MADPPPMPLAMPAAARLGRWRAPDGWDHRRFDWPSPGGRGRVLLQGGRADVIEKYLGIAAHLHAQGWSITSFDWRGQGGSGRLGRVAGVGHLDRFEPLARDLAAFWGGWAAGPGPHVLLAHSMGAHVALAAIAAGLRPDATVLSAPMVRVRSPVGRRLGAVLARWLAAHGDPSRAAWTADDRPAALAQRLRRLTVTRGAEQDERWWRVADPALRLGPPSWGWLAESFRAGEALMGDPRLPRYEGPVLFLVPDHDRLVDAGAARALAARMPGAGLVRFGREAAHEVLREGPAVRGRAFAAIDAFLDRVAPARVTP